MKTIILFLLFLSYPLWSTAQNELPSDKSFAGDYAFIESVVKQPLDKDHDTDRAVQQYHHFITLAQKGQNKQLARQLQLELYTLLLYRYYSPSNYNVAYDTTTRKLLATISAIKNREYPYLYPYALALYGNHLAYTGEHNAAFEYRLKAYELYTLFAIEKYPTKNRDIHALANSYYKFRDYYSAIKCFGNILPVTDNPGEYMSILNSYALCYRNLQFFDTCNLYFRELEEVAKKNNSYEWQLIAILNIGQTYYLSKQYDSAYSYFTEAYRSSKAANIDYGIVEAAAMLAKLEFLKKNYATAKKIALEGTKAFGPNGFWYFHYKREAQSLFEILADIYVQEGNYKLAYSYLDSLLLVVDSTGKNNQLNLSNAIQTKNLLLQSKYLQEKENAAIAQEQKILMRNSMLAGLALLTIIGILFISRQAAKNAS